jgi:hypothetical protein
VRKLPNQSALEIRVRRERETEVTVAWTKRRDPRRKEEDISKSVIGK